MIYCTIRRVQYTIDIRNRPRLWSILFSQFFYRCLSKTSRVPEPSHEYLKINFSSGSTIAKTQDGTIGNAPGQTTGVWLKSHQSSKALRLRGAVSLVPRRGEPRTSGRRSIRHRFFGMLKMWTCANGRTRAGFVPLRRVVVGIATVGILRKGWISRRLRLSDR